jgi:hypothetical protein
MEDAFEEGQGSCRAVEPMMDDEKQERDIKERRGERANKKGKNIPYNSIYCAVNSESFNNG